MFGCFGVCTCIYKITHIWLFDHTLGAYVFYIYVHIWLFDHTLGAYAFYIYVHIWLFDHTLGAYVYTQNVRVYIVHIYIYVQTEFRCLFLGLLAPTTCTGLSMFYIFERPLWGRTGQMCMYIQCMCICIYIYILVCVYWAIQLRFIWFLQDIQTGPFFLHCLLDKLECYVKKGILSPCSCKVPPRFAIRETYLEVQLRI